MSALAEKLRRARQTTVMVGPHSYTVTRPTDADAATLGTLTVLEIVRRFTVNWNGVTELSLGIPGGSDVPVQFDAELFAEWIADQPACWGPLADAIVGAYRAHAQAREDAEKN